MTTTMNTITYLSRICMLLTVLLWLGTPVCQAQLYSNSNEEQRQAQSVFHSTSSMTISHSEYASGITPVGATEPISESDYGTNTNNESSNGYMPTGPSRVGADGDIGDPGTPVGDGLLFLLLCASAYIVLRIVKSYKLQDNE